MCPTETFNPQRNALKYLSRYFQSDLHNWKNNTIDVKVKYIPYSKIPDCVHVSQTWATVQHRMAVHLESELRYLCHEIFIVHCKLMSVKVCDKTQTFSQGQSEASELLRRNSLWWSCHRRLLWPWPILTAVTRDHVENTALDLDFH